MKLIGSNNPKLKTICDYTDVKKAVRVGNQLKKFLKTQKAVGIAANQVGILERVCVVKIETEFKIFINPRIIKRFGKQLSKDEGCLSFPGIRGSVTRPKKIHISWIEVKNWKIEFCESIFNDFDAIVLEHEIDHLNGIVFIDKMTNKRYVK